MKEENIKTEEYPSVYWEKFFKRFKEIDTLPVKDWQVVHLLSYFSKRYEQYYGIKFSFKFNSNSPSKSFEVFQIRKLGQIVSSDPVMLKEYIDWFFETKILIKKKRITSISFMTDANTANEFKFKKLAMDRTQNIERTTNLPANILEIINKYEIDCKTYGDLAFIKKMVDTESADDNSKNLLNSILQSGFDIKALEKVK